MTQTMTVPESNKLIAEFMEWDDSLEYCKYSTSWDWLMPVVEKIEGEMFIVEICTHETKIKYVTPFKNPTFHAESGGGLEDLKIHHAYDCVIQFIRWYSENNKED